MNQTADIAIEDARWSTALPDLEDILQTACLAALDQAGLAPDAWTISLLLCDDRRMRVLNQDFRGRDKPTNVLSWPCFVLAPPAPGQAPPAPPATTTGAMPALLGDIALGFETVTAEAQTGTIPLSDHVTHLVIHGCFHLLGYDHIHEDDAVLMEDLESRAMIKLGKRDPYALP